MKFGSFSEFVVAKFNWVAKIPDGLSMTDAASLPVNMATAYHALFHTGNLLPGDRVLIHAAAGGVGQLAVQLAKNAGAIVIATAGSDDKLTLLREKFMVDHTINYSTQDFEVEVRKLFNVKEGKGCVDVILDSIGGSQLVKDFHLLRANGRVITFGGVGYKPEEVGLAFKALEIFGRAAAIVGVAIPLVADERPDLFRRDLIEPLKLIAEGKIKPVVSAVYPWEDIGKAQEAMESRKTTGKTVLTVSKH